MTGRYRHSRNPDYTGQLLLYAGIGMVANTLWLFLLLAPVLVVIQRRVILREEQYLEMRFGPEYRKYRQRVRRWL